jgi:DNA-binding GntR family transcriptional regulator
MVDGYSAFLAAQRISEQELAALRVVNERLAKYVENKEIANCGRTNAHFHELVAEATHNPRIQAMARSLSDIMCLYIASAPLERLRTIVAEHHRILEAIALRDLAGAQAAAREHVQCGYQSYLERSRLLL